MVEATFTPDWLARDMVSLARVFRGSSVLEPSAGYGALAIAAREAGAMVDCVELNAELVSHLRVIGFPTKRGNFLQVGAEPKYDAVVMNPPKSSVELHLARAASCLRPGGVRRIVALLHRCDAESAVSAFSSSVRYDLPAGTFSLKGEEAPASIFAADVLVDDGVLAWWKEAVDEFKRGGGVSEVL